MESRVKVYYLINMIQDKEKDITTKQVDLC